MMYLLMNDYTIICSNMIEKLAPQNGAKKIVA
jgi:hypothetical protein